MRNWLWIIFCFCMLTIRTVSAGEIVLDNALAQQDVVSSIEYFEDPSTQLTINDILREYSDSFQPYPHTSINEGHSNSAWWFRFDLYNNEQQSDKWWLNLSYALMDHFDVYLLDNETRTISVIAATGDRTPFASRPISTNMFWFPLDIPPQKSTTVLMRAQTEGNIVVPLRLYQEKSFAKEVSGERLLLGIYHGGAFFLMLYNIGLFLVVRERLYLYYVIYVASFLMISLTATGVGYEYLWPDQYWIQSGALPAMIVSCGIFGTLFSRNLLALKERSRRLFSVSTYFLWYLSGIFLLCLFLPYNFGVKISLASAMLCVIFVVSAGIQGLLTHYRPAFTFMIAWAAFLISDVIFILNVFHLLEDSTLSVNSIQIGSSIELLLLSFSVASRISQLKKQKTEVESVAKAEQAANKAKSDFLASMSHEIRTPMAGVFGMAELMSNTPLSVEQKQYLGNIQDSSRALLDIINQILDLSKIEANKLELESVAFNLDTVIGDALQVFSARRQNSTVNLELQIDPGLPAQLMGDPTRLRQILINLIGNAFKFTEKGSVTLAIQAGTDPQQLQFSVTDTGPGISQDGITKLFQQFTQENAAITRKYGGSGLGLTIAKQLVDLMGGEIGVRSQLGSGTTFWFTLPLTPNTATTPLLPTHEFQHISLYLFSNDSGLQRQLSQWCKYMNMRFVLNSWPKNNDSVEDIVILSDDLVQLRQTVALLARPINAHLLCTRISECNQTEFPSTMLPLLPAQFLAILNRPTTTNATSATAEQRPDVSIKIKHVLLAEDNPVNAQVIRGFLKRLGVECDWSQNGKDALEKMRHTQYDLVFMDCEMPIMDGYTATRHIRNEIDSTIPVIALTAHALKEHTDQAFGAGMNDYLTKPIDLATLKKALLYWSSPTA